MRQRLPLILSATALLVSVLGATPIGQAAGGVIGKAVPLALFAKNAGKLNGHTSSVRPKAGQIPVLTRAASWRPRSQSVARRGRRATRARRARKDRQGSRRRLCGPSSTPTEPRRTRARLSCQALAKGLGTT